MPSVVIVSPPYTPSFKTPTDRPPASKITLMGQSAGAASADAHNFAYWQDPIYTGFFGMSGTVFIGALPNDVEHTNFSFVAENAGCNISVPEAQLACMRLIPHTRITDFTQSYSEGAASAGPLSFLPVPDEKVMFSNYTERYALGKVSDRPATFSTCENEGASQVAYNVAGSDQALAEQVTLDMFQCPAVLSTNLRSAFNLTTYRYLYSGNFSNVSTLPWLGAYHGSDVPMLFGTHQDHANGQGPSTELEYETSEKMRDFLMAFMRDPHVGLEAEGWQSEMLRFGADGTAVQQIPTEFVDQSCA